MYFIVKTACVWLFDPTSVYIGGEIKYSVHRIVLLFIIHVEYIRHTKHLAVYQQI